MAQKRIPLRMCAICRERHPKREMIRLAKSADGEVSVDDTGRKPGRGLYICHEEACMEKALKGARLEQAAGVKIDPEVREALKERAAHES